jgi:hypothetical protein
MEYSTDKPTQEGWYWARLPQGRGDIVIEISNQNGRLCIEEPDGREPLAKDGYYVAWAGPLVPPV